VARSAAAPSPVTLHQLGLNRRRFVDPNGESNRAAHKIISHGTAHMVHVDV